MTCDITQTPFLALNRFGEEFDLSTLSGGSPLDVLTTVQPTPTATGNTTNLNSVFKDANGDTWIVDSNGDAVKAGSAAAAAPLHEREVVLATAAQTTHTLAKTPVGASEKVLVTRNGVDISDAWTWVGGVGTYTPSANYGCILDAADKLIFHYEAAV